MPFAQCFVVLISGARRRPTRIIGLADRSILVTVRKMPLQSYFSVPLSQDRIRPISLG